MAVDVAAPPRRCASACCSIARAARALSRRAGADRSVAGRIPAALDRFNMDNVAADALQDGRGSEARFRAGARSMLGEVVHYCGSGVAAVPQPARDGARLLGGGKLIRGPWSEWQADPARPLRKGLGGGQVLELRHRNTPQFRPDPRLFTRVPVPGSGKLAVLEHIAIMV